MDDPVSADTFLHQYIGAHIHGKPDLAEAPTGLDGKQVRHRDDDTTLGVVRGAARIEGFAWVDWQQPHRQLGVHRIIELREVDQ